MNRLIIIGNGFDLAHGIKSSFNDFITEYFCNVINTFFQKENYEDDLLQISFKDDTRFFSNRPNPVNKDSVYEEVTKIKNARDINFKFKSLLLERVYKKTSQLQWVDVEMEFFNVLILTKSHKEKEDVRKLNKELEYLKSKLVQYLTKQEQSYSNLFLKDDLIDCFCEKIHSHEVVTSQLKESKIPDKLYFLNFNYTFTVEDYLQECRKLIENTNINYIHGNLSGINGKPIFGFGDEFDKKYLEFEDEKNNDLFKHIKSFEYLQAKNFYQLTRFLESDEFQVHIYGHSCGISDRTMLNQIFEHDNCKSIKIYYHEINEEQNDFTDKTYEISRHFKDKVMLRKKLIPFVLSKKMPQPQEMY